MRHVGIPESPRTPKFWERWIIGELSVIIGN